jgi:SM-20-related protein
MDSPGDPADALVDDGVAIVPAFLAPATTTRLRERARALDRAVRFVGAGVGRGDARVERADVRGDRIRWIDSPSDDTAERALADALEALRAGVNRSLARGAFDLAMDYAI